MASSKIKVLIQELCEYLPQEGNVPSGARGDEKTLAIDISNLTMSDVSTEDLDYMSSILFQSNQSLLAYLRGNVNAKESSAAAVTTLLGFLVSFIIKAQRIIQPYVIPIKNCLMKLAVGGSSKIRTAAIETLCTLLDTSKSKLDVDDLKIGNIFNSFADDFSLVVTKTPLSVKGRIMELLGVIIRYHADKVNTTKIQTAQRWAFATLEKQLFTEGKEADNQLLSGTLAGLDNMLFSSSLQLDPDSPQTKLLYNSIKSIFNLPENLSRYAVPLAALSLFVNHGDVFDKFILSDSESLYHDLKILCAHKNRDLSSLSYRAMEKLLQEVSSQLATKSPGKQERERFEFFVNNFLVALRSKLDDGFRDLSVAIRGIGYFSPAFHKFMTPQEIDNLREYLVKISSWFYSESNRDRQKLTGHIPAFIQAYNYFADSLNTVTPSFMATIVELINTFVSSYIHLNTITRSTGIFAIRDLLRTLYYKGEGTLRSFLNDFLYNTLITTCTDDNSSNYEGQQSYMVFLYFWDVLLNTNAYKKQQQEQRTRGGWKRGRSSNSRMTESEDSDATDDEFETPKPNNDNNNDTEEHMMNLQSILFDEFLTALFRLIRTFNLELKKRVEEDDIGTVVTTKSNDTDDDNNSGTTTTSEGAEGITTPSMLQAVNEDHFIIFQNLVEFWCMLLPKLNTDRLKNWTYLAASALIDISLRKPLISGFYKMLSAMLDISHKRKLFEGYKELYAAQQQRKQLGAICDISETQTDLFSAFVIFRDFLKEVWHRLQQFKDELLASCLRVVLAYPLAFFDLQELVEPISTALRLGLTIYSLSDLALNVLYELTDPDISSPITSSDMNLFLSDILPSMNEYMLMDLKPKSEDEDQTGLKKWKLTTASERKRQSIHFKVSSEVLGAEVEESKISLRDIQLRVMRFLGRIGGANKLMLKPNMDKQVNEDNNDDGVKDSTTHTTESRQQLIAWDSEKNLKIKLPFPNARVDLAMDELLPRICELAESSPQRQIKVAACELLHGLVLSMIGDSAHQARDQKNPVESKYHRIYLRVFPILLRLSIDTEGITREMFGTLVRQLIHWLTNNAQYENPETIALLQACLDASCSSDAGLRDYGADCIQEFVSWSIRQQQSSRSKDSSAMNIKSVLKRLYNLASNPSSRQRLGACIIFNRIYRTFREENGLVNEFTLEILYWIFFSLKLAEEDHPLIGTLDQAKEAILHIKRIIRQKVDLFITAKPNRRDFHGIAEPPYLACIVGWTFDQAASIQREYARECMRFFDEFVKRIPGLKGGREWLSNRLEDTPDLLVQRFEKEDHPLRVSNIEKKDRLLWLRQLRGLLEAYHWLLKNEMVTLTYLLELSGSDWVEACVYLLDHSAEDMYGRQSNVEKTKAHAIYAYNYYHLVVLVTHAVNPPLDTDDVLDALASRGILTNEHFVSVVVQLLLLPNQFVEAAKAEQGSMPHRLNPKKIRWAVQEFLQLMVDHGPPKFHRMFEKACSTVLYSRNVDLSNMQLNQSALNDMLQIIDGIKILQDLELFDNVCKASPKSSGGAQSAYDYCVAIYDKFVQYNSTTEPVWIQLIGEMLEIAFHQPGFAETYAEKLLLENNATYANRLAVYQKFSNHINNCIATNFKEFAPILLAHSHDRFIHEVIIDLVEYLRRENKSVKKEITAFVEDLLTKTTFLSEIVDAWSDQENVIDLVKFLAGLLGADPNIIRRNKKNPTFKILCNALQVCLARDVPLSVKNEAFELIPMYITVAGDHIQQIAKAVDDTCRRQLGVRSTDLDKNSTAYREYITALDKLLNIMSHFKALWLFEIMFPMFIQEPEHRHRDEIQNQIGIFAKLLGASQFDSAVNICFNLFKDQSQEMAWRQAAINILIWLFAFADENFVAKFYVDNIVYIMGIVKRELLRRGTDEEIIQDMEERMCCFRLMQTMYEKVSAVKIHGSDSKVVEAYVGKKPTNGLGRVLTSEVVKETCAAKGGVEPPSSNPAINQVRRQYRRVAYNTLSTALMRTQKDEKFYNGFLFKDEKNERAWENIIDLSKPVNLPADLSKALQNSWYEDRIRRKRVEQPEDSEDRGNIRYMATLQSTTESLSQVSLSDMALESMGEEKISDEVAEPVNDENTLFDENDEQVTIDRPKPKDMIEIDEISENPCIKTFRNVVERLDKLTTIEMGKKGGMYEWMKALHKTFTSPETPIHVRLFFSKVIIWKAEAFEPYAEYWIRPLMKLILDGPKYGHPVNYNVHSLAVIVNVWGIDIKLKDDYDDKVLLFRYVSYLMEHCYYENIQVSKATIALLRDLFKNWDSQIIVPTEVIYKELITDRPKSANEIGLQLVALVLAHDMDPFHEDKEFNLNGLTEESFYNAVCKNLTSSQSNVYGSAAEVLGWALAYKKKHNKPYEFLERIIDNQLSWMNPIGNNNGGSNKKRASEPKFLNCIQRIQIHDTEIVQKHMVKVLYLVSQLFGDPRLVALNIIVGGSEHIPELFKSLQSKKLLKTLTRGDERSQLCLIQILDKISNTLTLPQIDLTIDTISDKFVKHNNTECRRLFFKFIQNVNKTVQQANNKILGDKIKLLLLQGLVDSNDTIRNNIMSYIKTSYNLQDNIYERLKTVLRDLYMAEVEEKYIFYSTEILLDTTKNGDEYDTPIFKDPLPNARFDQNYQKINTSWQLRNAMSPLFVATQEPVWSTLDYGGGGVRATQNTLQFSLTQSQANPVGGSNTLMASFVPTAPKETMDIDPSVTATISSQPGTFFVDESQRATNDYRRQVGRTRRQPIKAQSSKYIQARTHIVNATADAESMYYSYAHDRLRKRVRISEQLRKQARDKRVTMTRQYRYGELPDVQIKHSELVLPLQVLGRNDNDISRLVYALLSVSVSKQAAEHRGLTGYREEITTITHNNLEESTKYFPPAIGTFLRICYEMPVVQISSSIINIASQRSYNQHIAIALLEKHILSYVNDDPEQPTKKARKTKSVKLGKDKKQWIDLAQLYKSVDQPEIFQNLYQSHVASISVSKDAIDAEIQGHYADAVNLFVEAHDSYKEEVDPEEVDLWMQEMLRCYEQLTEWQDMGAYVNGKFEGNFDAIWSDTEKDEYIKYFMRSYTKLREGTVDDEGEFVSWTEDNPNPVLKFIASASEVPEHMEYLLHHVACDVSLNAIWTNEYDRARFYTRQSYDSLLSVWTSLHPLAYGSRMAQLANLERTVELEDFLDVVSNLQRNTADAGQHVNKYIRGLLQKYPDPRLDSMDVWDDIIDSRNLYLDELNSMQRKFKDHIPNKDVINDCKKQILKVMLSAANGQQNVNVVHKRMKLLDTLGIDKEEKTVMNLENRLLASKMAHTEQKRLALIAKMIASIMKNKDAMLHGNYKHQFSLAAAETYEQAKRKILGDPDTAFTALTSSGALASLINSHKFKDAAMFANHLNSTGYEYLRDTFVNTMDEKQSLHLQCLWKLAEYCDSALASNESDQSKVMLKIDTDEYSGIVIDNYFKAMELGKNEAIERFPRLLELIERYPANGPHFKSKAKSFGPTWMYIRWIPQMVAILDNPIAEYVFPALYQIAKIYPKALYYAFSISYEHYMVVYDTLERQAQKRISKIAAAVKSELMGRFILELRRLTNPEHLVVGLIEFLQDAINNGDIEKNFIKVNYHIFEQLLMNPNSNKDLGSIPKDFAVLHSSFFLDLFGRNGSKLSKLNARTMQRLKKYYQDHIKKQDQTSKPNNQLTSYSPFLAEFQGIELDEDLEIPGQYTGYRMPHPEDHVKVVNFDQRLLVLSSQRKPKRLRIHGSDERDHNFLVKGGEDLRLDQRIEQLFVTMNDILRGNPYCARHNVTIRTYKVVPMATDVGMIEWVNDTLPLQACLNSIEPRISAKAHNGYIELMKRYHGDHQSTSSYNKMYNTGRDRIVAHYHKCQNVIRADLLREYFLRLAASPEAFLHIRDDYINSLSATSISGYILGIGDRHLENFLVDLNSGQLIPIDFGHAFGSATELLPVAELMPFRLTRQLTSVCEPIGIAGMLETPMIQILQAFQENKNTLLNSMDVFIKEPLLDWRKIAMREAKRQMKAPESGGSTAELTSDNSGSGQSSGTRGASGSRNSSSTTLDQEIAWYPQQKLETARNKLSLENPGYTMAQSVLRNSLLKGFHSQIEKAAKGEPEYNIRARVGEKCASVQEQVRCLIDLATDPAILGRTYTGWSPTL